VLQPATSSAVDHAAFGPVEAVSLSRIQKVVAATLSRNWATIPHVTHHDEADISGLDALRTALASQSGEKVTPLAFMMKAAVVALKALPRFNASFDSGTNTVFLKQYYHIGFAVDTPGGLVVPVIRDVDQKDVIALSHEIADLSSRARARGLPMSEMQGGSFTLSSLGSIGGTGFTPIINAPEVAILGTTRSYERPVKIDGQLAWRTVLPLSLSYDHRVINGADAARFCIEFARAISLPDRLAQGIVKS
jgi:pyruvate dehydrogenase E2 component (dihydrolipoamide acetyltransferase)